MLLNDDGIVVCASTVGVIIRAHSLQANTAHIGNRTLDEEGKRDLFSSVPGIRLCSDITYLPTGEGWLYLATVLDLYTGMIIG